MKNVVRIILLALILLQIHSLTISSPHEQAASGSGSGSAPAGTSAGAGTTAAADETLTTDQQKVFDDWKANLIPFTKVGGKDLSEAFEKIVNLLPNLITPASLSLLNCQLINLS